MSNNDDKDRWETFCKLYDKLSSKEEMRGVVLKRKLNVFRYI